MRPAHCRSAVGCSSASVLLLVGCAAGTSPTPAGSADVAALIDAVWSAESDGTGDIMRMEELIAQCMADAGFAYTPVSSAAPVVDTPAEGPEPGTLEYAEAFGYGVTVGPPQVGPPQDGEPQDGPPQPEESALDPNAAYVAALPQAAQEAYRIALTGDATSSGTDDPTTDGGEWRYDWRQSGCQGWAQNRVYGDPLNPGADDVAALHRALEQARLAAEADQRTAEVEAAWAACMAAAGHPGLAAVGDAEAGIRSELAALWHEAWSALPANPTETDVAVVEEAAQDALDALALREIQVALADLTCRDEVDYTKTQQDVNVEYQQRFYEAHQVELEAWLASTTDPGE